MKVRCGACRTEFDVAAAGRHACPACGAVNQVAAGMEQPPGPQHMAPPQVSSSPTPTTAPAALPKVSCPECSFEFVVGDIDVASCPNCSAEVPL